MFGVRTGIVRAVRKGQLSVEYLPARELPQLYTSHEPALARVVANRYCSAGDANGEDVPIVVWSLDPEGATEGGVLYFAEVSRLVLDGEEQGDEP